jgi:unsaturated rhamnogalacturonyl hydrolase
MKRTLPIICLILLCHAKSNAQPLSQQMAASVMQNWKDSFALDGKPAKWTYDMGVILKGFEGIWLNSGDATYYNYIQKMVDAYVKDDGTIKTYKQEDYNLDNINNGRNVLLAYRVTQKDKYLKAARTLREQLRNQPRTNGGGFWHKKIYPNQMWLDGLYMAEPFYAEFAWLSHDDTAFNDIAKQFIEMENHAADPKTGLLYHAWDESKQMKWASTTTGQSPHFWSRAIGWYLSALVDVLDYFPESNPQRKTLLDILKRTVKAVEKEQDIKTGLWKDVLHYTGPGSNKNYLEASASCQFVYVIAKSVRLGYLPAADIVFAKKGYAGIVKQFIVKENGQTVLKGTVKVSGLGGNPFRDGSFEYYMSEPVITNDPKGIGTFLLASNEMEMLPTLPAGRGKTVVMDNYFNRETKIDSFGQKIVFHYKWWEEDNGGFSMMAHIIHKYGMTTRSIDEAPNASNLKNATIYFLIDPDWPKENKTPNYIEPQHIEALVNYVKNGGVLVMMANDSNNVEFKHYNELAERFGIHWNENMRHDVIDNKFEQGEIVFPPYNAVFRSNPVAYIKQLCTLNLSGPAKAVLTEKNEQTGEYENIMAVAKFGKGAVFAVGDPWFYNEYLDGRKLPSHYQNYEAATDLIKWLINPKHPVAPYTNGPSKGYLNQ